MKIDEILVQMGSRRFDQNQMNLTQKNIIQNLELESPFNVNPDLEQNFENFRIICDPSSNEKLSSDVQFSVSVNKFWKSQNLTTPMRFYFNQDFTKFAYVSNLESEDEKKIVFKQNCGKDEIFKFKNCIDFPESKISKLKLKYLQNELSSVKIYFSCGKKSKIKLRNQSESKNKNKDVYEFRFSREVIMLVPIITSKGLFGFVAKCSEKRQAMEELKEDDRNLLTPNLHSEILNSIKNLELRIDISYFLKSTNFTSLEDISSFKILFKSSQFIF